MDYKLEVCSSYCTTAVFVINGVKAEFGDFGDRIDRTPESAGDYGGCGDLHFTPVPATEEILLKYAITEEEYEAIGKDLEDQLSFGACGWCV